MATADQALQKARSEDVEVAVAVHIWVWDFFVSALVAESHEITKAELNMFCKYLLSFRPPASFAIPSSPAPLSLPAPQPEREQG